MSNDGDWGLPSLQAKQQFDPAAYRYIEVLAAKAQAQQGAVRQLLNSKVAQAVQAYEERFQQAQSDAQQKLAELAQAQAALARQLQPLFEAAHFAQLRCVLQRQQTMARGAALSALVEHIAKASQEPTGGDTGAPSAPGPEFRPELKGARYFRSTWVTLSVERHLRQALKQGPGNAGPLNSHMLVLRSIALLRRIAPEYLNHFMAYADALLWLEQAEAAPKPGKAAKPSKSAEKKRPGAGARKQG